MLRAIHLTIDTGNVYTRLYYCSIDWRVLSPDDVHFPATNRLTLC
jgi:hypothetical protein